MGRRFVLGCVAALIGVFLVGGVAFAASYGGTSGPDEISGTNASDVIRGFGGDDCLSGRGGDDDIYGGNGSDVLYGNRGDDYVGANDGLRDTVRCGDGKDFVYADPNDLVYYGCETVRIDRSK